MSEVGSFQAPDLTSFGMTLTPLQDAEQASHPFYAANLDAGHLEDDGTLRADRAGYVYVERLTDILGLSDRRFQLASSADGARCIVFREWGGQRRR